MNRCTGGGKSCKANICLNGGFVMMQIGLLIGRSCRIDKVFDIGVEIVVAMCIQAQVLLGMKPADGVLDL